MRKVPELLSVRFRWNPKANPGFGRQWTFVELRPERDTDNYVAQDFLERPDTEEGTQSIPGRAVLLWSLEYGIRLYRLNPPASSVFTYQAADELVRLPNWPLLIEGGCEMRQAAELKIRDYFEGLL